ncbi:MAG: ACT domain-containing protein [Clostridia bacterium]|nr:ACT domain-containing protein [Clostridia bacterium]
MLIKQLSVFVENKKGRLMQITKILAENNINMSALSIADTTDFGILRIIVNDPDKAQKALSEAGVTVKCTEVCAFAAPDKPGELHKALAYLVDEDMNIEYMYAFIGKKDSRAIVVVRVDNPQKAVEVFKKNGVTVVEASEAYNL